MRFSDVVQLAQQYLLLSMVLAVIAAAAAAVGYFFVYKKMMKGRRRLSPATVLWGVVFFCYLVVVFGGVLMSRGGFYEEMNTEWMPFSSYMAAWNSFDTGAWRNIILNIILFVPLGFLLPLGIRWFRKFYKTYLTGILLTVVIEGMQLFLHRGIFETDDIINNLLGTMIGYGFFTLAYFIAEKIRRRPVNILPVITLQIPLAATITVFAVIFGMYAAQDLGNLPLSIQAVSWGDELQISGSQTYSDKRGVLPVYEIAVASPEETEEQAGKFFAGRGTELDSSATDLYDDTAVYYDTEGNSLWIDYAGSVYSYTDFDVSFGESLGKKAGASFEEVRDVLESFGVGIPEGGIFTDEGEGRYRINYRQNIVGETMYDGFISLTYMENGKIAELRNQILTCKPYGEYEVISEQEAYEKIKEGKAGGYYEGVTHLKVGEVSVVYMADSKGYYQPVYCFEAQAVSGSADSHNSSESGEIPQIYVPAIEKK